jgi:hypothetical protein
MKSKKIGQIPKIGPKSIFLKKKKKKKALSDSDNRFHPGNRAHD